jgi:hypothetical protein
VMKDAEQEHRSNSCKYEHSRKDESRPKEDSFKPVLSPTGNSHDRNLHIHVEHTGAKESGAVTVITDDCDLN